MSYLVLHIDVEFIAGVVCADNGTTSPITNGKESFLWLYFFSNPHQNTITYGKDNKAHFNNSEVNYYGNFFEKIINEQETFLLRGINHPLIDLLKVSNLLGNIRKTYQQKTHDSTYGIQTLLTFSSSICDNAKQITVDYLNDNGFEIKSYTIPLAELVGYYTLFSGSLKLQNGGIAIFLEATNSTLHLMKLSLADNYFLLSGGIDSRKGMGFDPRKIALLRFIVNEANKSIGALDTEDEKIEECRRLELHADEWLKKLDAISSNTPHIIRSVSFLKMSKTKRDVLVRKTDLDSDSGAYTRYLNDIFDAYRSDNIEDDVVAVFFLGDCFQSDRVKISFRAMLGEEKIIFYANEDIHDILAMYPKIDITRYASEESRIKERAKAEEAKHAEQLALEDRKRKEQEAEAEKAVAELKAAENRKEAKRLFELAVELDNKEKFEDSRINVENAVALDEGNKEYKQFFHLLNKKIKKLNQKNELYKKYLKKADRLFEDGEFSSALEEYEAAKYVFDNPEIIAKIIEVKRLVKHKEKNDAKIAEILTDANNYIQKNDFSAAKEKVNTIVSFDPLNVEAKKLLTKIDAYFKQEDKKFKEFVKTADEYFDIDNYEEAKKIYNQALMVKSDDKYCVRQIQKIVKAIDKQKENQKKCNEIIKKADKLFKDEKWGDAKEKYQIIIDIFPQNSDVQNRIEECHLEIKKQEGIYKDYLMQAIVSEKKSKLNDALESLEYAQKIKPDDGEVKKRIKNIKFKLQFGDSDTPIKKNNTSKKANDKKSDDFFLQKKTKSSSGNKQDKNCSFIEKNKIGNKDNDDFLGLNKAITDDDDFLGKSDIC